VRVYGYHVPKNAAEKIVSQNRYRHLQVRPYEDRSGVEPATHNYGVWHPLDFYWVFVDVTIEE
jgi:hypothetical protein